MAMLPLRTSITYMTRTYLPSIGREINDTSVLQNRETRMLISGVGSRSPVIA
jgi:hypothetical protein